MVIAHNLQAMNAERQYGITVNALAKTTERLSSGYKVNRAADDAAGLAISEKLRKKIRGLDKGMENVEDGISLCQVADGALDEVTLLFQRARELSIQAYNGTNSKSDRQIIQDEIDQCLKEADRVFETTKFNEIYIFRNGYEDHGTYLETTSYTVSRTYNVYRDIPSWIKLNDQFASDVDIFKIEEHQAYGGISQDMTGIMKQDFRLSDNSRVSLYFGPDKGNQGGYQWVGDFIKQNPNHELLQPGGGLYNYIFAKDSNGNYKHIDNATDMNYLGWTPTTTDNATAKIDFSELTKKTDITQLYEALGELVGVELAIPCGTCPKTEGVKFVGSYVGANNVVIEDQGTYISNYTIDLNTKKFTWNGKEYDGYFQAVLEVMNMSDTDPDKATKTANLAQSIAADLAVTTYNAFNQNMTTHFDRSIMLANDPYSVYVYDYRDDDAAQPDATSNVIRRYSKVQYDVDELVTETREVEYDHYAGNPIWIQASDETPDGISIKSTYLSIENMNLVGYSVNSYRYVVTMSDPEGYARELEEWYKSIPAPEVRTVTKEIDMMETISAPVYESVYKDGEYKYELVKAGEFQTVKKTVQIQEYVYPADVLKTKPVPTYKVEEIYEPSDLSLLDDAITKICKVRSYYGAIQNRLEHTYKNNDNVRENLTAAESQIRDTDMADEMVKHSKYSILAQAGESMIAQANQQNQGVLALIA